MSEPSLTDRVRELHETRQREDQRIQAMASDVRLIRTEIRGMNQSGNLALGNSREAVELVSTLTVRLDGVIERLAIVEERIENMAQWAKTKGKP